LSDLEATVRQLVREIVREELERHLVAPTAADASPWLSIAESAVYLRVSERKVHRMIKDGRIRSTTIGRRRLLHRDHLDEYATTGEEVAPTTPPRRRKGVG
jgi:excisionase family DNA binding protein